MGGSHESQENWSPMRHALPAAGNEMTGAQFEDMDVENVDMPDQAVNGFDFEWED